MIRVFYFRVFKAENTKDKFDGCLKLNINL